MRIFKDAVPMVHGTTKKKFVYKRYNFNRIFNVVNNIMQTNTKVLFRNLYMGRLKNTL